MNSFWRMIPYIWPHRRMLYLSAVFALLVALLWGMNLSVAFPIVKVLLEEQSLADYVDQEIQETQEEIDEKSATLDYRDNQLQAIQADISHGTGGENDEALKKKAKVLKKTSRETSKLSSASRRLTLLNWCKTHVIPWLPEDQFDVLALIMGLLMLATVLKGICIFVQEVLTGCVVELTAMGIRKDCFRRVLHLDHQTLSLTGTPELMARFTNDLNIMSQGLRLMGGKVIREPLKAITCLVLAFCVCWQLTLLALLLAPLVAVVFYRIGKRLKQASHRVMESMSRIYKTLEESFDSMKVVIAFNGARRQRQRFHRENKTYYKKAMKIVRIDALTSPTTEVLAFAAAFLALLPGCYLVLRDTTAIWGIRLSTGQIEIGHLALMYVFLAGIIDPARKLSTTYGKLKRATAAADRLFDLMDLQTLVKEPETPIPLPRHSKCIEFDEVSFAYAPPRGQASVRPPVLREVSLRVAAGEVLVVVGENGSGKSTLVNLLPRFFDPTSGAIRIDGVEIRDVRLRDLRRQIGVVTQETLLFDETIYENIRYGNPLATREQIYEAARQAHVVQFLDQLPDGFDTVVGEKGNRLSGGQRQRIALARAILRDPAILILDEATSAIDSQSERLIHQALRSFTKGRTTFLITHSVSQSILNFVSRIVVMDQGRLAVCGPHEAVLEASPIYRRLFHAQSSRRHGDAAATESGDSEMEHESELSSEQERSIGHSATGQPESPNDPADAGPHIIPLPLARSHRLARNGLPDAPDLPAGGQAADETSSRSRSADARRHTPGDGGPAPEESAG